MGAEFKDVVVPFDSSRRDWEKVEMGGQVNQGQFVANDLESYFFGGRDPWWADGIALPDDLPWEDAQEAAGMDWETVKEPVFTAAGKPVPGAYAIERSDTGAIFPGTVGEDFTPFHNTELFQFGAAILEKSDASVHTAFVRRGGSEVNILFRLHDDIVIGGDPDEKIDPFLNICAGHIGNRPLTAITTPVRTECRNTQRLALKGAERIFKARHTKGITDRVEDAQKALALSVGYYSTLKEIGDLLVVQKVDKNQAERFLSELVPYVTEEQGYKDCEKVNMKRGELRAMIRSINDQAPDQQNIKGTAWGWLQASLRYDEYLRPIRVKGHDALRAKHTDRALYDESFGTRALEILQEV